MPKQYSYWTHIFLQFIKKPLGVAGLLLVCIYCIVGVYAPFLASSKPFFVYWNGIWYFPLFRYLFYSGFFTKNLDIFFNLLLVILPIFIVTAWLFPRNKWKKYVLWMVVAIQFIGFAWLISFPLQDPSVDLSLIHARQLALRNNPLPDWNFDLQYMTPYAQLNLLIRQKILREQNERLEQKIGAKANSLPTLWAKEQEREAQDIARINETLQKMPADDPNTAIVQAQLRYLTERRLWIHEQIPRLRYMLMPFFRPFHWEDDAGGDQHFNQQVPWYELTRINRKDLAAALIFGVRVSLVVGITAVSLALAIGIPIGAFAGFYGGNWDILVSRLLEIWESMPTFFMLLMVVAISQTKTIFLVIAVIGIFGWTGFSRYIRGEFFKQRNLAYVEACRSQGFNDSYIMFSHILPNAIPPVLTLLPFAMMGAITSEAGLSFLGLGEEGSCSWGVLMDEGRTAFPGESYLLWPPAILLTILLVAIALVGDSLRDSLDPKLHK
jgi:peptide/nickel transport system permease protein